MKAAELIVPIPELEDGSPDWRVVQQVGFFFSNYFYFSQSESVMYAALDREVTCQKNNS